MLKIDELLKVTGGKLVGSRRDLKIKGISIDTRIINPQDAFIAIKGDNFDGHDFIAEAIKKGATCIIHQRRLVPHSQREAIFIEVKDTIKALGDIARFQRNKFDIPVIAVTGSNGKTTTKEMIAQVLSKKFKVLKNAGTKNNHIGLPLTLLNFNSGYSVCVLEIGTNHFGEVAYLSKIACPNIGIITNIGPAHLEYLHNLKGIFNEKYSLIENLKRPKLAILNADDNLLRRKAFNEGKKPFTVSFGIKNQSDFFVSDIKILDERIEFLVNPVRNKLSNSGISNGVNKHKFILKTLGYFNIYNALVAIAVARLFGMKYKDIAKQLSIFDFPESRLELIKLNHIKFIDDTYNSNPLSLKLALDVLANFKTRGRKIFVMGDMLELGNQKKSLHYEAGREVARVCNTFITVGKLSKLTARAAKLYGFNNKNIFTCESTRQARNILFNEITPKSDDIVLVKGSRLMKMEEIFKV